MKKLSFIFLLCMFSGNLFAASLKVSPAGFIIHNVTPGRTYSLYEETKLKLSVYNDDMTTHTYMLSVHKPSELGRWEKGYLEIPDPDWCWFEKKEIIIAPQKVGYGNIFIQIPAKECYYNQHWIATLAIRAKPERGIGLGLGINVRVQIETKSRNDIKGRPDGIIGFKPSIIQFENFPPGSSREAKAVIYNNNKEAHTYKIDLLFHNTEIKPRSYLTHSFKTIPDRKWIILDKDRLTIKPNGDGVLSLKLNIPDESAYYGKKWEEILLVQPDEGLPGFIRVQIETSKENK